MRSQAFLRLTILVMTPVLLVATGGSASASGIVDYLRNPPPYSGVFVRAGVPVYADSPDSMRCHLLENAYPLVGADACNTPTRRATQVPGPAWTSTEKREPITLVICERGNFDLIETPRGRGWAPAYLVETRMVHQDGSKYVLGCGPFTWS